MKTVYWTLVLSFVAILARRFPRGLTMLALALVLPAAGQEQFNYTVTNDAVTITGYIGLGGDVIIPHTIDGLPVTSIGAGAFQGVTNVTAVTIPNSITSIGYFGGCRSLTAITLDGPAANYHTLDGVLFWRSFLIQYPAAKAGSYVIPDFVTVVSEGAFVDCTGLTDITIPNSLITFSDFEKAWEFWSPPFLDCTNLSAIAVGALNPVYSSRDGVLFDKGQTTLLAYPLAKTGSYTIPNTVTGIGRAAFYYCRNLTGVTIPTSVVSIGSSAFFSCNTLTNISIPNSVTTIEGFAFGWCDGLTSVIIPDSLARIETLTFAGCTNLTSVAIPNGVTNIGPLAFFNCPKLPTVTIPSSVATIWDNAFLGCISLSTVWFDGDAPVSPEDLFADAPNANVYYLPDTLGWGPTFGGVRAQLWNPQAEFPRIVAGQFAFNVRGPSNAVIVVEACTNLSAPAWLPVGTNTLDDAGTSSFSDPQSRGYASSFYRFRSR